MRRFGVRDGVLAEISRYPVEYELDKWWIRYHSPCLSDGGSAAQFFILQSLIRGSVTKDAVRDREFRIYADSSRFSETRPTLSCTCWWIHGRHLSWHLATDRGDKRMVIVVRSSWRGSLCSCNTSSKLYAYPEGSCARPCTKSWLKGQDGAVSDVFIIFKILNLKILKNIFHN